MDNEKDMQDFSLEDIMRQLQEATQENQAAENPNESTGEINAIIENLDAAAEPESNADVFSETVTVELSEVDSMELSEADALELAKQAFSEAAQEPEAETIILTEEVPAEPSQAAADTRVYEIPEAEASEEVTDRKSVV